jgi:hypothetical protein
MPYEAHRTGHSFLAFWRPESTHSHGFGRLYYGSGVSYGEMGSLAETDAELDIHPPQKNSVPDCPVKYAGPSGNVRGLSDHVAGPSVVIFGPSGTKHGWSE